MIALSDFFHDAATFVALEPEDAAAVLVEGAQRSLAPSQSEAGWPIFLPAMLLAAENCLEYVPGWPKHMERPVRFALAEAIGWLKREGLIMNELVGTPSDPGRPVFTRRGLQMRTRVDMARYREATALPVPLVHKAIAERVIPQFLRGDRDSAVSYAFREVEIAVRRAAGYDDGRHGMAMMREALHPKNGPLTDRFLPPGEQEAEQALFAGAIGHGRNPVSHRDVDMTPTEAARLILLASHLLSVVEKRIVSTLDKPNETV